MASRFKERIASEARSDQESYINFFGQKFGEPFIPAKGFTKPGWLIPDGYKQHLLTDQPGVNVRTFRGYGENF